MTDRIRIRRELDEHGFVVFEDFIDPEWLDELRIETERLFEQEGEQAGSEFRQETGSRRLANLVNKGDVFRRIIVEPQLLDCVEMVLGPEFKLSSLNARSASPHNGMTQPLHADMGAISDDAGFQVCNSVWLLDDFTLDNGPLRVVPGSHHWRKLPQDELQDPIATHPDEVTLTAPAGTVIIMNAHAWHGGTANRTDRPRRAIHAFYARRDFPQQQYQKLLLDVDVQANLSPAQRRVLALDDALNDDVTTRDPLRSGFLK